MANIYQKNTDTLQSKSYDELEELFYNNQKDTDLGILYASSFLKKAKKDTNTIKIADGYHLHFFINTPEIALQYVDSIIELTKDINHYNYPSRGYLNKGVLLQNDKKINEAFGYYLKAKDYAEKNHNDVHLVAANTNIAFLKLEIGKIEEALTFLKVNYKYLQKKDVQKKFHRHYVGAIIGLAGIYNNQRKLDSARIYINEGLKKTSKSKEKYGYTNLLFADGINNYYKGNYSKSIDSLQKTILFQIEFEDRVNDAETNLFLAKAYEKQQKLEVALEYFKKVYDIVESDVGKYNIGTREAYVALLASSKKESNTQKQLEILEKMIILDSVSNVNHNKLNIEIHQKYDTKKLISEKNELKNGLKQQKYTSLMVYGVLGAIIVGFSFFLYRNYSKRIYYKKQFDLLMRDQIEEKIKFKRENSEENASSINLPKEVVGDVLEKLESFEEKNKFTDNTITLAKLAKKIGTNSSYLSKIINFYKNQNFANYINDLRITYVVHHLKTDIKFRKYTVKAIAEEIGFNNVQSFTTAFHKKTGLKPSYFIKELENQSFI